METVVYPVNTPVLQVQTDPRGVVVQHDTSTVLSNTTSTFVLSGNTNTVLIETEKASAVLAGSLGPRGLTAEDADMYSKRVDFISDNLLYKGEANVGSSEASPVWRIRKVDISNDGDVSETWASGTSSFDKVWADRASLIYS